uniref:Nop domain-containing protein n=1 Tax=Chlamydomonas leiostraca TaxID=1034604 RepID=A0A7S0RFN5_9CHLO
MLVLFESPAGFALFKVLKEGKIQDATDLADDFATLESAQKMVKLKAFSKFENTTEALAAATALVDSKLSKPLKKFLKKHVSDEELAIVDKKLGGIVQEKLGIPCIYSNGILELTRGIRSQLQGLISSMAGTDLRPMSLGLSHSLSRYKLKFSPDKVDTMIVQAIGLLDDLDKELNTYAMRVREWYGWHFPEMTKIVTDNIQYAKVVKLMGTRDKAAGVDFSGVLEEDVEQHLKDAAIISMGTEISGEDLSNIQDLCNQVIDLSEYRGTLFDYLKSRMNAIAPNLTVLVGELVGARLIAHAGSLINLAKQPASTVQILGAEKALFRALKTKHETPKYGLIYHASLIGQSSPKFKGKISRVLAAKCALAIRVDALGDSADAAIGIDARAKVEARMRQLEGKTLADEGAKPRGKEQPGKQDKGKAAVNGAAVAAAPKAYNADADVAVPEKKKKKKAEASEDGEEEPAAKKQKKDKKDKKDKKKKADSDDDDSS